MCAKDVTSVLIFLLYAEMHGSYSLLHINKGSNDYDKVQFDELYITLKASPAMGQY